MTTANRKYFVFSPFAAAILLLQFAAAGQAWALEPATGTAAGLQRCLDVELSPQGRLVGRCPIAKTGATPAKVPIEKLLLWDSNNRAVAIPCDAAGNFVVDGLHGGTYQFTLGTESWLVRTWAAGTAPPIAVLSLQLESNRPTIRGQWAPPPPVNKLARAIKFGANNPLIVSGVLAAAVGIPVAVHNINQDDNS